MSWFLTKISCEIWIKQIFARKFLCFAFFLFILFSNKWIIQPAIAWKLVSLTWLSWSYDLWQILKWMSNKWLLVLGKIHDSHSFYLYLLTNVSCNVCDSQPQSSLKVCKLLLYLTHKLRAWCWRHQVPFRTSFLYVSETSLLRVELG